MGDKVPFDVTQVTQSICFSHELLHRAAPQDAQPGSIRLADAFRRKSLAHSHQCDFVRVAARATRRCRDPLPHLGDIFCNRHNKGHPHRQDGDGAQGEAELRSAWTGEGAHPHTSIPPRTLRNYIIAVGGAGSSGLPAFASGTRIITSASTASAASARRNGGAHWARVPSRPEPTPAAPSRPQTPSPAISPEALRTAPFPAAAFCPWSKPRQSRNLSVSQRITPPIK